MKTLWALGLLLFYVSCSSVLPDNDFKRRETLEYYRNSDVGSYFLMASPEWLSFSTSANCKKNSSVSYFNFDFLRRGQAFSYEQALEFQLLYNLLKDEKKSKFLSAKMEEDLFFETVQKINAHFLPFPKTQFERLHLIWVDGLELEKLKKIMASDPMMEGLPIFISLCQKTNELKEKLLKEKLLDSKAQVMGIELFSVFNSSSQMENRFLFDFSNFFNPKQKLHLFLFGKKLPPEFEGNFEIHP